MTERRFIYTFKKNGTMVIIDKKDNVLIRDKYRACDYLNRLNNENEQLKEDLDYYKKRIKELEIENQRQSDAIDGLQGFITHYDWRI